MTVNRMEIPVEAQQVFAVLEDRRYDRAWLVGSPWVRSAPRSFRLRAARSHRRLHRGSVHDPGVAEVVASDPPTYLHLRAARARSGPADIVLELVEGPRGTVVTMTETVGTAEPARIREHADGLRRIRNSLVLWRLRQLVAQRTPAAERCEPVPAHGLPAPLARILVRAFASAAAIRGTRALHARGLLLVGRATLHRAATPLGRASELQAVVRLSRGAGLPEPWPDFDGVAVRLIDAHGAGMHQDLLFTSAGSAPVLRQVIRPTRSFAAVGFSTVLPYRHQHRLLLLRVDPLPVATLQDAAARLPFELHISCAPLLGPWRRVATVVAEDAADDEAVRFDPWNTGPELAPAGLLNEARLAAYAGSRAATPADASPGSEVLSGRANQRSTQPRKERTS